MNCHKMKDGGEGWLNVAAKVYPSKYVSPYPNTKLNHYIGPNGS